jgi:hypothetical protein
MFFGKKLFVGVSKRSAFFRLSNRNANEKSKQKLIRGEKKVQAS